MRCVSCNSGDGSSISAFSAPSIRMNSLSSLLHVSGPDSLDYSVFYGPLSSSADKSSGVEKEKNIKKDK
jgi:hypothetical protein